MCFFKSSIISWAQLKYANNRIGILGPVSIKTLKEIKKEKHKIIAKSFTMLSLYTSHTCILMHRIIKRILNQGFADGDHGFL